MSGHRIQHSDAKLNGVTVSLTTTTELTMSSFSQQKRYSTMEKEKPPDIPLDVPLDIVLEGTPEGEDHQASGNTMEVETPPGKDDDAPNEHTAQPGTTTEEIESTSSPAGYTISLATGINTDMPPTPPKSNPNTVNVNTPDDAPLPPTDPRKLKIMYEDMKKRYSEQKQINIDQKKEYETIISEMEATIKEVRERLGKPTVIKMTNEDIFVAKAKKGTKVVSSPQCTVSGCEKTNIDLIKCNMCGKLVCDDCSGVKVSKLRPVMNQCSTLYFTCKTCDTLIRDTNDVNVYDVLKGKVETLTEELDNCEGENSKLTQQVKTLEDQHSSLQVLLEERESSLHESEAKLNSMEQTPAACINPTNGAANIEELINKRFDKIDESIDAMIERKLAGVLAIPTAGPSNDENAKKLFSAVVGASDSPVNHVTALKSSQNAELIEKQEQERRANNIIIHGISEVRSDDVSIQDHDQTFLNHFLEAIDVDMEPKQIVRLGNENADKKRPLKVILKSADDKRQILSSLNKLKNADASVRGVSVRDDYTIEERKLIRSMHEEARRKNEADNVTHWKVRGTPKNGLRVVKITARN